MPGLRPGRRVVALREVAGTPHPARTNSTPAPTPGLLVICPPGEGSIARLNTYSARVAY